jgi:hypothetical protein
MNHENLWTLLHQQSSKDVSNAEVLKMRPPLGGGALLVFGGGRVVCMRDIFILNEIWTQEKVCILVGTLLG